MPGTRGHDRLRPHPRPGPHRHPDPGQGLLTGRDPLPARRPHRLQLTVIVCRSEVLDLTGPLGRTTRSAQPAPPKRSPQCARRPRGDTTTRISAQLRPPRRSNPQVKQQRSQRSRLHERSQVKRILDAGAVAATKSSQFKNSEYTSTVRRQLAAQTFHKRPLRTGSRTVAARPAYTESAAVSRRPPRLAPAVVVQ